MNKFLAMAFILCSLHLEAQTWQRLIDNPFNFGGAEAYGIRVIDDTIFVSSAFVVTDTTSNTRSVITKHNVNDGSLLQFVQFKSDSIQNSLFNELNTGFNQLYQTDDEQFYLPLNIWNDDIDSLNKPKLLTIDRDLQQISSFPISGYLQDDLYFSFNGTRIDSEGNILLYGSRSRIGNYYDADSANTLLVKMTPQGEQLWTRRYSDCYTINFAEPLSDGDIILNAGEVGNSLVSSKFLIKTNGQGEEQWRRLFGGMATSPLCTSIESSTGKIITANSWNYSTSDEQGLDWWLRTWIQLQCIEDFGSEYQIQQDVKWAPTSNIQDVYGIEEMTNGNFLSWGIMQNTGGGDL
jgi:hypothetical protein